MATGDRGQDVRVLVVARHPVRLEDLGLAGSDGAASARLLRRPASVESALEELQPDVVVIDTGFADGRAYDAIGTVRALAPEAGVLGLTPDPPPLEHVALAMQAGAAGVIDVDSAPDEFRLAIEVIARGDLWLPPDEMRPVLSAGAGQLEVSSTERRSRMTGVLLGLIPLTGFIAAIMAFLWRKYLGQIGVRPVDIAVDPASRVVDAIVGMLLLLAVFGPLLFVGSWLDQLRTWRGDRGAVGWLTRRTRVAQVVLSILWIGAAYVLTRGPDVLMIVVVGPVVGLAVLAKALDFSDELPPFLRIPRLQPMRVLVGLVVGLVLFLSAMVVEAFIVGPDLGRRGERGFVVPRVLGFNAQPVEVFEVDDEGEPRELLYLGGNADLYVLVDPCDDDTVEFVSVGAHRLVVIDEISCATDVAGTG